jgi:hypothetical protein
MGSLCIGGVVSVSQIEIHGKQDGDCCGPVIAVGISESLVLWTESQQQRVKRWRVDSERGDDTMDLRCPCQVKTEGRVSTS